MNELAKASVDLVEILPTKIWIENGICGDRSVVLQHEGCEQFKYATFGYNYAYTSNAGTWEAAQKLARELGATDPIEIRYAEFPTVPTERQNVEVSKEEKAQILRKALAELEGGAA